MTKVQAAETTEPSATEGSRISIAATFRKTRKTVTDKITDYNEKYLVQPIEKGREKVKCYNEKYVSKPLEKGVANGKKLIRKMPIVISLEQKVNDRLRGVPSMINMPSKGEIEKLTLALESLNNNIETLKKQKTA